MEGLEISVLNLSEVLADNTNRRIDSEYFRKQFISFFKDVPNLRPLSEFVKEGYRVVYEKTKIIDKDEAIKRDYPYFLQATDLDTPFIKTDNLYHVHQEDWERYEKGRINPGEILIEVKGKIDKVAIVPDDFPSKTLVTGSLFKLSVNNKISKHLLLTYLICKYGVAFKDRFKTNLLISYVSKPDLFRIPIPYFSKKFNDEIDSMFELIFSFKTKSNRIYAEAENLLIKEVGLENINTKPDTINIKSFSESFGHTGRLDAEYYQSHFVEAEKAIKKNGFTLLKDVCSIINYGTVPTSPYTGDESGIPYIKGMNIKNTQISTSKLDRLVNTQDLPDKYYTQKDDIIISQMGTVGDVGVVRNETGWLFASFTIRARLKKDSGFDPVFTGLFIQNVAKPYYLLRNIAQASVRQNTDLPTIRNLYLPNISLVRQQAISQLVEESFDLKNKSEQLLENAKRAVEIAIEKNESVALKFLQK